MNKEIEQLWDEENGIQKNHRKQINELKKKLKELQEKQEHEERYCSHEWGDIIYCPDKDYHEQPRDRWSRECEKCGKVEYTHRQKAAGYQPDYK